MSSAIIGSIATVTVLVLVVAFGYQVFAQDDTPDWELPTSSFVSNFSYLRTIGTNNLTVDFGVMPIGMDINGDGLVDWVYRWGHKSFVELNTGSGWERVYDCDKIDDIWVGDCDYKNGGVAAAVQSGGDSTPSEDTCYLEEGGWVGNCAILPQ